MNPNETKELMETIHFVRDEFDMTILLIEHDMKLVSGICEKLTVLNFGQVLAEGATGDVLHDPQVIKAYLDKRAAEDELFAKDYAKPGKNIDDCCDFIISEVKKSGRNGFDDDEVYGMAVHYYNEEEVSFTKNQNCTIVTNLSDQTKENLEKKAEEEFKQAKIIELQKKESAEKERLKKKAEAQRKKDAEIGQLSLFDF